MVKQPVLDHLRWNDPTYTISFVSLGCHESCGGNKPHAWGFKAPHWQLWDPQLWQELTAVQLAKRRTHGHPESICACWRRHGQDWEEGGITWHKFPHPHTPEPQIVHSDHGNHVDQATPKGRGADTDLGHGHGSSSPAQGAKEKLLGGSWC